MPGKSRRKRGGKPPARKARSPRQGLGVRQAAAPGESDGSGQSVEAGAPLAAAPAIGVSPKVATARQSIRHPYIGAELRTIGVLAVLMLVVLVVLKLVVS